MSPNGYVHRNDVGSASIAYEHLRGEKEFWDVWDDVDLIQISSMD